MPPTVRCGRRGDLAEDRAISDPYSAVKATVRRASSYNNRSRVAMASITEASLNTSLPS